MSLIKPCRKVFSLLDTWHAILHYFASCYGSTSERVHVSKSDNPFIATRALAEGSLMAIEKVQLSCMLPVMLNTVFANTGSASIREGGDSRKASMFSNNTARVASSADKYCTALEKGVMKTSSRACKSRKSANYMFTSLFFSSLISAINMGLAVCV